MYRSVLGVVALPSVKSFLRSLSQLDSRVATRRALTSRTLRNVLDRLQDVGAGSSEERVDHNHNSFMSTRLARRVDASDVADRNRSFFSLSLSLPYNNFLSAAPSTSTYTLDASSTPCRHAQSTLSSTTMAKSANASQGATQTAQQKRRSAAAASTKNAKKSKSIDDEDFSAPESESNASDDEADEEEAQPTDEEDEEDQNDDDDGSVIIEDDDNVRISRARRV